MIAEMHTRRFQTLTYAKVSSDPEDLSLFDRRRRRNVSVCSVGAAPGHRPAPVRGDGPAPYEVSHYDLDVSFDPDRQWLDGRARLRLRVTANAISSLTLRLAEDLTVRSVYSAELGRLLALRVPQPEQRHRQPERLRDARDRPQPDRHVLQAGWSPRRRSTRRRPLNARPSSRCATRRRPFRESRACCTPTLTYWYPQGSSGGYATASMHLTVPEPCAVVASGQLAAGVTRRGARAGAAAAPASVFAFEARQPVRYLACLITRLIRVSTRTVSLVQALAEPCRERAPPRSPRIRSRRGRSTTSSTWPSRRTRARPARGRSAGAGGRRHDGVLHVPGGRLAVPESHAGAHREGAAGRPQPGVPRRPEPAAADRVAVNWSNDPAAFQNFPE